MTSRRCRRAIAVVALVVLAACGPDGGDDASVSGTPLTAPGGGGATTVVGGAPPGTGVTPGGEGGSPGETTISGGGGGPVPTTSGGGGGGPDLDANVPTGQFAPSLLRPDRSQLLVLEIQSQPGAEPFAGTLSHLEQVLESVSGKPVEVRGGGEPSGGARDWTGADLRSSADAGSATPQGGGTAVIRLLFVHGSFEGRSDVLGIAVRGDVGAVFSDQVDNATTPLLSSGPIESAVSTHELGHLLGLVDLVRNTGRQDPEHPGHSRNSGSVMFWAVESDLIGQLLGGGPPQDFDGDDLADLAAIREGRP